MQIIVANWKMNKTATEGLAFVEQLRHYIQKNSIGETAIIIAPSFPLLSTLAAAMPFQIAAQTVHHEASGAFTGEVSAQQVSAAGATYVLVGHSERRALGETDQMISEKIQRCLENNLTPIVCVGETREQRDNGETEKIIEQQLNAVVGNADLRSLRQAYIIAYEPIWAIGGTTTPTLPEISGVHQFIKKIAGEQTPVLYGGSVTPENSAEILQAEFVDGVLVGRASLQLDDFVRICYAM